MSAERVLVIISLLFASGAAVMAMWSFRRMAAAADSLRLLAEDTRVRLVPLMEKADVTVDAANAELLRIDAAITRFEDASVRVSSATGTLTEIVQAPAGVVTEMASRVRRAWKHRPRRDDADVADDASAADDAETTDAVSSEALTEDAPHTDPEDPWHKTESL